MIEIDEDTVLEAMLFSQIVGLRHKNCGRKMHLNLVDMHLHLFLKPQSDSPPITMTPIFSQSSGEILSMLESLKCEPTSG